MILWSLEEAGVPLFRKDLYDYNKSNVFKSRLSRLSDVDGIGIEGNELLLSDKHGDRIVLTTLHDEGEEGPLIEINGYASLGTAYYEDEGFHGRMAVGSDKYVSLAMEIDPTAWIYRIAGNSSHKNLDRRDGNSFNFRADHEYDDSMGSLQQKRAGREMALGKVTFPLFGGNNPPRKKRKPSTGAFSIMDFSTDDEKDGFGRGGPWPCESEISSDRKSVV